MQPIIFPLNDWSLEYIFETGEFLEDVNFDDDVDAAVDDHVIESDAPRSNTCLAFGNNFLSFPDPVPDRDAPFDAGGQGRWEPTTPSGLDPATAVSVSPSPRSGQSHDSQWPVQLPSHSVDALVLWLFLPDLDESFEGFLLDKAPSGPIDEKDMTTTFIFENGPGMMALSSPLSVGPSIDDQPSGRVPTKKKKRIRKSPPKLKTPVELTDLDVICERGGRNPVHPGTMAFRRRVQKLLKNRYADTDYVTVPKSEKTALSKEIVDWIHRHQRGRFVTRDKIPGGGGGHGPWYEVNKHTARQKVSQRLRDQAKLIH